MSWCPFTKGNDLRCSPCLVRRIGPLRPRFQSFLSPSDFGGQARERSFQVHHDRAKRVCSACTCRERCCRDHSTGVHPSFRDTQDNAHVDPVGLDRLGSVGLPARCNCLVVEWRVYQAIGCRRRIHGNWYKSRLEVGRALIQLSAPHPRTSGKRTRSLSRAIRSSRSTGSLRRTRRGCIRHSGSAFDRRPGPSHWCIVSNSSAFLSWLEISISEICRRSNLAFELNQ